MTADMDSILVFSFDRQYLGTLKYATLICIYVLLADGGTAYVGHEHVSSRGRVLVLDLNAHELQRPEFRQPPLDIGIGLPPL